MCKVGFASRGVRGYCIFPSRPVINHYVREHNPSRPVINVFFIEKELKKGNVISRRISVIFDIGC